VRRAEGASGNDGDVEVGKSSRAQRAGTPGAKRGAEISTKYGGEKAKLVCGFLSRTWIPETRNEAGMCLKTKETVQKRVSCFGSAPYQLFADQRVAKVRAFLTVGFCPDPKPTVNSNDELTVATKCGLAQQDAVGDSFPGRVRFQPRRDGVSLSLREGGSASSVQAAHGRAKAPPFHCALQNENVG
jgi:hypothetical protein